MTTINDISDLVQVLRDRPDWLAAVRSLVLGDELLDLPQQLARFVESTEENFRLAQEQTRQVQEQIRLIHQQLERLEGKAGNFEGAAYERRVRTRVLLRLEHDLGMASPVIVFHQEGLVAPEMNRLFRQARQSGVVRPDEIADLQDADTIFSDSETGSHAVVEVSITADNDDIFRAERRARIMGLASGAPARGVVVTARLHGPQESLANDRGVTALVLPNR